MPIPNDQIDELCAFCAAGNPDAISFLKNWMGLVRIADNIADGDSDEPVYDMGQLLVRTLLENSANRFFQAHMGALSGAMSNAITLWVKSEDWKRSENRKTRMFGFVWREAVEHVAYTVAMITGGMDHALAVAESIQKISHQASPETLEEWEAE